MGLPLAELGIKLLVPGEELESPSTDPKSVVLPIGRTWNNYKLGVTKQNQTVVSAGHNRTPKSLGHGYHKNSKSLRQSSSESEACSRHPSDQPVPRP
jgi:hypothetical protein